MSRGEAATSHFRVFPGSERFGGGMTVLNGGGRGRERRVVLLALVVDCPDPSPVPSRCPW